VSVHRGRRAPPVTPEASRAFDAIAAASRPSNDDEAPPPGAASALRSRAATSRPKPPEDSDERLATFQRGPEGDPGRTELRVSWCFYNSGAYLRLHAWERGADGQFWPVKGSAHTIRRRELAELAEAVAAALDRSDAFARRAR
jgi:hypothetical protein